MPPDLEAKYPDTIGAYREHMKRLSKEHQSVLGNAELRDGDMITSELFEMIFAEAIRVAQERGVPLYCGEYGVIDRAPAADALNWYRDINGVFEKNGIGRAAWSYKKMDFGLIDAHYETIIDELIKYL